LFGLNFARTPVILLVSVLFGISLGLGMPSCMEAFVNLTDTKSRGRYSGLIMFLSCVGTVSLALINVSSSILLSAMVLIVWRSVGLIPLLSQKFVKVKLRVNNVSFAAILEQRSFILYLIPWLMFSIVNYLSIPVQTAVLGQSTLNILTIMEGAIIGIFAVISGFLIDIFGRKRIAIAGFVLVGIGYSVLGLYPYEMASWYFYTVVDGLAWGIFYVMFVILIWGDLSFNSQSEKYYAIGILPFFISQFLELGLNNYVATNISHYALFSFVGFFLFLAVLPLVYAPETLPEKTMQERELKIYVEKAIKQAEKEAGKSQRKESAKNEEKEKPEKKETEKSPGYDEARKLAEKYY
jgi:MFS family permease